MTLNQYLGSLEIPQALSFSEILAELDDKRKAGSDHI
jgi:hypothetical protein